MQTIKIHELGPIKNFHEEISDFMVITGEQSSGKSTIAKSVFFFKNIPELLKESILKANKRPSSLMEEDNEMANVSLKNRLIKSIRLNFLRIFGTTWHMDPQMYLQYNYADGVSIRVSLTDDNTSPNYIWIELSGSICSLLKRIESRNWDDDLEIEIRSFFALNEEVVYIPAGRSMLTLLSDQLTSVYFTMDDAQKRTLDYCTQNYLERILRLKPLFSDDLPTMVAYLKRYTNLRLNFPLLEQAEKLMSEILQGQYQNEGGEERLYLSDDYYVKINFASSGQQETVWILNVLFYYLLYNKKAYFIIEEPESHLYPNVQRLITDFIAMTRVGHDKILITTHSPYVLGEINNLLYAGEIADHVDQKKLDQIISSKCWIRNDQIMAYYTDGGNPKSCMTEEGDQIRNEVIDGASDKINAAYDNMLLLEDKG